MPGKNIWIVVLAEPNTKFNENKEQAKYRFAKWLHIILPLVADFNFLSFFILMWKDKKAWRKKKSKNPKI